jgi:hypothetical protein
MKVVKIALGMLALSALVLIPLEADAAVSRKPKILLHVKATTTKNQCTVPAALNGICANTVNQGDLATAYHMQVVVDLGDSMNTVVTNDVNNGLAGVQFGITYPGQFDPVGTTGINVFGWNLCGVLEFAMPGWPGPGTGNLITWNSVTGCQRGRMTAAGYFYMAAYAAGTFQLLPRQADMLAKFADCNSFETVLTVGELGAAQFSAGATATACNPCLVTCGGVAVQPTTWSSIKALNSQ